MEEFPAPPRPLPTAEEPYHSPELHGCPSPESQASRLKAGIQRMLPLLSAASLLPAASPWALQKAFPHRQQQQ